MNKLFLITATALAAIQFSFGQATNTTVPNAKVQKELKYLNEYLATFEIENFKNIEIKDGYLLVNYENKTDKISKTEIKEVRIVEKELDNNIQLICKNPQTGAYARTVTIVMPPEDVTEVKSIFDDLLEAWKGDNKPTNTATTNTSIQNALNELNEYLKTFNNDQYRGIEIADGYLIDSSANNQYSKAKIEDLDIVRLDSDNTVVITCKNKSNCVYSSITKRQHGYFNFQTTTGKDLLKLQWLLKNLFAAMKGEKLPATTTTATKNIPLKDALAELNDYLKTFSNYRCKGIEVKDGYVYSRYDNDKYSKASMADLSRVILIDEYKYIKVTCKNNSECIYSSTTKGYHSFFNFSETDGIDLGKLKILLENFLVALKADKTQKAEVSLVKTTITKPTNSDITNSSSEHKINYGEKLVYPEDELAKLRAPYDAVGERNKKLHQQYVEHFKKQGSGNNGSNNTPIKPEEISVSFNYTLSSLYGKPKLDEVSTYQATPITITVTGTKMVISKYGTFTIDNFQRDTDGAYMYKISGSNTFIQFKISNNKGLAVLYTTEGKGGVLFGKTAFKVNESIRNIFK